MGAVYSSGFVPKDLQHYQDYSLANVQTIYGKFRRLCESEFENNAMFLTKEQFTEVLDLSPEVGHKHFAYFDQTRRGRVSAMEIWGAMALCCSDREEPKVGFIYTLMDLDKDGAVNRVELTLLLHAVGKGVARMKQIAAPGMDIVEDVVEAAFAQAIEAGNELACKKDLLDLYNFVLFLKADDAIRRYRGRSTPSVSSVFFAL